jgi:TonB family protein
VVDASGNTTDIQITSPAGMGLDEKAVEAIRGWKFEPVMKDAQPVPVAITIETQFDLY